MDWGWGMCVVVGGLVVGCGVQVAVGGTDSVGFMSLGRTALASLDTIGFLVGGCVGSPAGSAREVQARDSMVRVAAIRAIAVNVLIIRSWRVGARFGPRWDESIVMSD